jgi:lambda family phage minor tail protein L
MEQSIHNEIMELEPSTLIILYELVLKGHNASYYFHAGENSLDGQIKFKGKNYYYIPIKTDGFDFTDSKLPRPTLTVDNTDSFFSLKTRFFKDFIGYTLKRTRTFVKFLHGDNFPRNANPFGTPTEVSFPVESYVINKKNIENKNIIQFELVSPLEQESAFIPNRKIVYNTCQWKYRGNIGCGYNGPPVTDSKGNFISFTPTGSTIAPFNQNNNYQSGNYVIMDSPPNSADPDRVYVCTQNNTLGKDPSTNKDSWIADACPKNISGCRARFKNQEATDGLPFGGFPGTWEY